MLKDAALCFGLVSRLRSYSSKFMGVFFLWNLGLLFFCRSVALSNVSFRMSGIRLGLGAPAPAPPGDSSSSPFFLYTNFCLGALISMTARIFSSEGLLLLFNSSPSSLFTNCRFITKDPLRWGGGFIGETSLDFISSESYFLRKVNFFSGSTGSTLTIVRGYASLFPTSALFSLLHS